LMIGPVTAMLVLLSFAAFCSCSSMMYPLRISWSSVLAEMCRSS
jgi:hypothetical protein